MDFKSIMVILGLIALIALYFFLRSLLNKAAIKRAGRQGERVAARIISNELRSGDVHLKNVEIRVDGKKTELDNLIINKNGIFVIEVKNYIGELFGREEDTEWYKQKTTDAYNVYGKTVRNPIGQLKREIWLLKKYLKENGINAWIEGYVYFVQQNAPCYSDYFLQNSSDIQMAVHKNTSKPLSEKTIDKIVNLLR